MQTPPRLKGLENAVDEQRLVLPELVSVVTGKDDNVCDYQTALRHCAKLGITDLSVIEGEGHDMSHDVVSKTVDTFLGKLTGVN
ncbi:hypothetical protein OAR53_03910 [Luminiphilus sp.]|nr:hypothetical protein [Luminiphilus sp.]